MNQFYRSAQLLLILLAGFAALRLAGHFPFYYSWDMDLIQIQDMLLMQNDQLPTHYAHPGLGMNFLLFLVQDMAQNLGLITKVSMGNLHEALQPLVVIAEQTDFLRQVNAVFCILLAVVFWKAFEILFHPSRILSTLVLVIFLLTPGLWNYNIPLIRTETYSLLLWGCALIFTFKAALETEPKKLNFYVKCIGVFAMFSFFTKIQSLLLILLLPFLFFYLRSDREKLKDLGTFSVKKYILTFVFLCLLTIGLKFPNYVAVFKSNWLPNKFFFIFCCLCAFIYLTQNKKFKVGPQLAELANQWSDYFKLFIKGGVFVLLIPLLLPMNFFSAAMNSLFTFKVVFLRHSVFSDFGALHFWGNYHSNFNYFVILGCCLLIGIFNFYKNRNLKYLIYFASMLGLILLHLTVAVRDKMQDRIWLELPVLMFGLVLASQFRKPVRILILLGLIGVNFYAVTGFKKYKVPQDVAYFNSARFLTEGYRFGQYDQTFLKSYPTEQKIVEGLKFSAQWKLWKAIIWNNFSETSLGLKDIEPFGNDVKVNIKNLDHFTYINSRDMILKIYSKKNSVSNFVASGCHQLLESSEVIDGTDYNLKVFGSTNLVYDEEVFRSIYYTGPFAYGYRCELSNLNFNENLVVVSSSLNFGGLKEQLPK